MENQTVQITNCLQYQIQTYKIDHFSVVHTYRQVPGQAVLHRTPRRGLGLVLELGAEHGV